MSAAQVKLAKDTWTLRGAATSAVLAALGDEDECCVCMSSLSGVNNSPYPICRTISRTAAADPAAAFTSADAGGASTPCVPALMLLPCGHSLTGGRPHCLHAHCAERWLFRKASCPVCRCDVRPLLPKVPTPPAATASRPPSPRAFGGSSTFGSATARSISPRNSRPGSPRDATSDISPRSKRFGATMGAPENAISMRELAALLPPNRAVGVGGKMWVGWRHVY